MEDMAQFKLVSYTVEQIEKYNRLTGKHRSVGRVFDLMVSSDGGKTWKEVATQGISVHSSKASAQIAVNLPLIPPYAFIEAGELL